MTQRTIRTFYDAKNRQYVEEAIKLLDDYVLSYYVIDFAVKINEECSDDEEICVDITVDMEEDNQVQYNEISDCVNEISIFILGYLLGKGKEVT